MIHQMNQVGQNLGHHFGDVPRKRLTHLTPEPPPSLCVANAYYSFFVRHLPRSTRCGAATCKIPLKPFLVSRGSTHTSLCYDFIMIYMSYRVSPSFPMSLPESVHVQQATRSATSRTTFNPSSLAQQTCLVASPAILSFSCYCFMQQPR